MKIPVIQRSSRQQGAAKYLALIFALVFLVFQSSTLLHSHNGDLNKHIDCAQCLQLGSNHDALPTAAPALVIPALIHAYRPLTAFSVFVARVPANSRAPPLVS